MRNPFLLHLREQRRLIPKQIEERTGIPANRYMENENGPALMPDEFIKLLTVLLRVNSEYLQSYCHQLHVFAHHKGILDTRRAYPTTHLGTKAKYPQFTAPRQEVAGSKKETRDNALEEKFSNEEQDQIKVKQIFPSQ